MNPESRVIHQSEVLRLMNLAIQNHQQVSFRAWKIGRSDTDPERGQLRHYDHVYPTSHSPHGTYNILDPLATHPRDRYRTINEALIAEFQGKKVIW